MQEVLLYARAYGKLPSDLVGSLTGLTEGAHFPIAADARYADDISARAALKSSARRRARSPATPPKSSPPRRPGAGSTSSPREGAPVVAVNDGVIRKFGSSPKLGKFVVLEDTYGNRYTYAELGEIVREHRLVVMPTGKEKRIPVESQNLRPRLRALPDRAAEARAASGKRPRPTAPNLAANDGTLRVGSKVIAGTVLARVGAGAEGVDPHINFSIRPAGRGAPRIDPKPILDGWKLLEATAIYRAKGKNPFAARLSGAGVLLLSKEALQKRVLADEGLSIYTCGREDIASRLHRPPHPGDARLPAFEGLRADDHLAQLRPRLPHHLRQRLRAHHRRRGRHRDDQRRPGDRAPGPRHADRRADPRRCCACRARCTRTR